MSITRMHACSKKQHCSTVLLTCPSTQPLVPCRPLMLSRVICKDLWVRANRVETTVLCCIYTCMHASDAPTWSDPGAPCLAVVDVLSIEHHLDTVPTLIFITPPLYDILLTRPATTSAGLWDKGKWLHLCLSITLVSTLTLTLTLTLTSTLTSI